MKKISYFAAATVWSIFSFNPISSQVVDPVKWSAAYKPLSSQSGEITFTATIDKGYHIYGAYFEEGGPVRTHFTFPSSNEYSLNGKLKEVTPPVRKKDPTFDNMEITLLSGKAIFFAKDNTKKQQRIAYSCRSRIHGLYRRDLSAAGAKDHRGTHSRFGNGWQYNGY